MNTAVCLARAKSLSLASELASAERIDDTVLPPSNKVMLVDSPVLTDWVCWLTIAPSVSLKLRPTLSAPDTLKRKSGNSCIFCCFTVASPRSAVFAA